MPPERLEDWTRRLGKGLRELPKAVQREAAATADAWEADARRRAPGRRLPKSLQATSTMRGSRLNIRLTSEHPGAYIQDVGGRVRAGRRDMPVPIGDVRVHPRSVAGLFMLRAKDGRRFLATRGAGGLRLWFRLMSEVQIRGTFYGRNATKRAAARLPPALLDRIHDRVGP